MAGWREVDPGSRGVAADLARQVWSAVGCAFFRELAKHFSTVLGANFVYIGELCPPPRERLSPLAVSSDGVEAEGFDYYLAGTACGEVLARGVSMHERRVRRAFPSDRVLAEAGGEALAGKALYDSNGSPIGAIVALWRHPLDDTSHAAAMLEACAPRAAAELERKIEEDRLRESEQRYQAFIAASSDAMWRVDFDEPIPIDLPEDEQIDRFYRLGFIAECNQAAAHMLTPGNASIRNLLGSRVEQIIPRSEAKIQELRQLVRAGYKDTITAEMPGTVDNPRYAVRSLLGIVENGKLLRFWGKTRDISDLRKAEREWHASERRFRQLLESIRLAAVMLDVEGRVTFCNDHLLATTGWSRDDVLGKNVLAMIPPEERDAARAALSDYVSGRRSHHHIEVSLLRRDGTRRLFEWDSTVLLDAAGKAGAVASLGRDVTDQRILEARLRETSHLESLRRMAGAIAHDFNNLLTIIGSYGSDLREESGAARKAAEEVVKACEQGAALTRQLLSFSRDLPVKARPVKLNEIVTDSQDMLRHVLGRNVQLVCDLDPSPPTVVVDPGQVHQVLVNLAMNARDAMPRGGVLTITSRRVEIPENRPAAIGDVAPGAYQLLEVEDTGTGMPEEVRRHVFEPFFTTKQGHGTGLGLSSVYGIIRRNGGYISVDSTPGKGSTFRILLPVVPEGGAATGAEREPKPGRGPRGRPGPAPL